MDYRKECESRMLEVSIGAHKLTQMISSWSTKEPNPDHQPSSKDLLKGRFDVEDSITTLRKLQQATKMMSRVREDLRVNLDRERGDQEAGGFGLTHSRRFESNCIEELKTVIRESSYGRNLDERGASSSSSSSRSLRFSASSSSSSNSKDHLVAQPKRAKGGPNLIAKLMGLEAIPSEEDHEEPDKCLVRRLEPPLGIEMLKARMLPLMEKKRPEVRRNALKKDVVVETVMISKGIDGCTNMTTSGTSSMFSSTSNRSSRTYGEVPPPIVILRTPPLPERKTVQSTTKGVREKACDSAQILSERLEKKQVKKRREIKPEAKPLQDSTQLASARVQQQQRRMSSDTRKRDDVVVQKSIPSPASPQAKLSSSRLAFKLDKSRASTARSSEEVNVLSRSGANAPRSHPKSVTWGSMEPAKAKKQQETRPSRKAIDIILAATGNAMYNDAKTINQSRPLPVDPLPNHKENSKHCNRGHRRRDPKVFCEIMVKAGNGGRHSRSSSSSEAKQLRPDIDKTTIQIAANAEDMKPLLLSSQSFINHAQELLGLDGSKTTTYRQKKGIVEVRAKNAKLLLGCARELVVHKSRQLEGSNHPLNRTGWLSRSSAVVVAVDQLVEEIADEVEKLQACGKVGKGAGSDQDVVYGMIEGDLGCKKSVLLNAMWDQGWMEWICLEEVDYVVGPLERLIMCGLIEELVLDLLH